MDNDDRNEELEATIRRVKLLVIEAKMSSSEALREQWLKKVCMELRKFLAV